MAVADTSLEFSASYDRTSKILTAVFAIVPAIAFAATGVLWILVAAGLLLLLCYAFSPRRYEVLPGELRIRRLAGAVTIPRSAVRAARKARGDDMSGAIRLGGNGGLFGYYGFFRTSGLGMCRWYVTNRRNAVVVFTDSKTLVVSPDDPELFLDALAAPGTVEGERPAPVSRRARRAIFLGVAALALLCGGLVALAIFYAPGPPDYTLSRDSLRIDDRFYPVTVPANSVDLPAVRVVDVSSDPAWRPVSRTNGFANAHYQSGWFRVQGGPKVRLYRAGGTRLVLLPRTGGAEPVLLQVDNPQDFIDRLRQMWSR